MPNELPDKLYEITIEDGYFRTNVWGDAGAEVFEASTKDLLALRDNTQTEVNRLLCDIRQLKPGKIDIVAQTRGIGTLWSIRTLDKVAFLMNQSHVADMMHQALSVTNFNDKFRSFEDEAEAIAWLKS